MLQVFHADVLSILTGVPEVQRYIVDRCPTDITAETAVTAKSLSNVSLLTPHLQVVWLAAFVTLFV